jgi:hypothetical protein
MVTDMTKQDVEDDFEDHDNDDKDDVDKINNNVIYTLFTLYCITIIIYYSLLSPGLSNNKYSVWRILGGKSCSLSSNLSENGS